MENVEDPDVFAATMDDSRLAHLLAGVHNACTPIVVMLPQLPQPSTADKNRNFEKKHVGCADRIQLCNVFCSVLYAAEAFVRSELVTIRIAHRVRCWHIRKWLLGTSPLTGIRPGHRRRRAIQQGRPRRPRAR